MRRILIVTCIVLCGCKTDWDAEVVKANIETCERLGIKPVVVFWQDKMRVDTCQQAIQP